ncbi:M14-type cytosolic carboxypeptidase [Glaciecola sp. 1036]|uniref:M14 family metallopeptidase n=1 Tax=Alteromonadaceae TaxID=72275 RepID=UPI003D08C48B
MQLIRTPILLILFLIASSPVFACDFGNIQFSKDFDGGKLDSCKQLGDNRFMVTSTPEDEPINPSPWYAFKVSAKTVPSTIEVMIHSPKSNQRYVPKISTDGEHWQTIDFEMDGADLHLTLNITDQEVYVSGQELLTMDDYQEWMQSVLTSQRFTKVNIGKSFQQRPIDGLIVQQDTNNEWLIVIGRQHPPEVTGAIAMQAFIDKLAQTKPLTQRFFERFNLLVVPLVNPDGVTNGNWRHNNNGKDLNRDWGKFTQPETTAIGQYINGLLTNGQRVVFALDFHSTQQDIFYTMPTDYGLVPKDFSEQWLAALKNQRLGSFTVRERPGSSPGRGVFKQYIADTYGVHAVTYELGDNTERKLIPHIAKLSAQLLMQQMLATPKAAFIPQKEKL